MGNFVVKEMKINSQNSLVGIRDLDACEIKYVGGGESEGGGEGEGEGGGGDTDAAGAPAGSAEAASNYGVSQQQAETQASLGCDVVGVAVGGIVGSRFGGPAGAWAGLGARNICEQLTASN